MYLSPSLDILFYNHLLELISRNSDIKLCCKQFPFKLRVQLDFESSTIHSPASSCQISNSAVSVKTT